MGLEPREGIGAKGIWDWSQWNNKGLEPME